MKNTILPILFSISFLQFSCDQNNLVNKEEKLKANQLKKWSYEMNYAVEKTSDSIQPIAEINFKRTEAVTDKKREELYGNSWLPSMEFEIYRLENLSFCEQKSNIAKTLSSCTDPNKGGDLIVVQNFVLLNYAVCTNCISFDDKTDYCRPFIKEILSDLNLNDNSTLEDLKKGIDKKITRVH